MADDKRQTGPSERGAKKPARGGMRENARPSTTGNASFRPAKGPSDRTKGGEQRPRNSTFRPAKGPSGRTEGGEQRPRNPSFRPAKGPSGNQEGMDQRRPKPQDGKPSGVVRPMDREHPAQRGGARTAAPRRPGLPPRRMEPVRVVSDGMPARRLALDVIRAVTEQGAYAALALNERLNKCTLPALDRRLAVRLVYDTLEHIRYLDFALSHVMAKPDTDIRLVNILRLAACQILVEDRIPESAATNTAVTLCKELGMEGLSGVCNGILRNLLRQKDSIPWPDEQTEPVRAVALQYSVPEWLVERLSADYGMDEAKAILAMHGGDLPVTIRRNLTRGSDEAFEALLQQKAWQCTKGLLPHSWQLRGVLNLGQDRDFCNGLFSIQSPGSMLACMAAAPTRGQRVLDACAAPGGKSCLMAEMMQNTGRVQAWEIHPHRTELIESQVRRLGLDNVRPMTRDALQPREDLNLSMDVVLLDAPCSGTGDLADKPDIRLNLKEENLAQLIRIQRSLLDTVCAYVREGGTLLYATCSVLKDENERQVAAFLQRHPEFEAVALPDSIPAPLREQQTELGLQLLPNRQHMGGFYLCKMRRRAL